jgi:hypothetical protein
VPTASRNWIFAAIPLILEALMLVIVPGYWPEYRAWTFVGSMALLAAELAVIGWLVNGRPMGAFIDNRNRLSLSKLQAGAWTVIVLSAFATAAAFNAAVEMFQDSSVSALAVTIPGELLLAMGISATSLVATPALLSLKSNEDDPSFQSVQDAANRTGTTVTSNGKVATKSSATAASWADLVTGDEVGNIGSPDLGKIQQGFITLLLLGCYIAYIYADFAGSGEKIASLPAIDPSFVWLMGISHASYLAYKAVPHTTDGPQPAGAAAAAAAPAAGPKAAKPQAPAPQTSGPHVASPQTGDQT